MNVRGRIRSGECVAALAATVFVAVSATPAAAEPKATVLRQITNITTGTIESARLRLQDGREMAFVSTGDVMGPGTETATRQIYYWRELDDGSSEITRITNNPGCESYEVARPTDDVFSDRPKMLAFVSTCDLDPDRDNSDGNPEIFIYDLDNPRFYQITDTTAPVVNGEPFTSDSGLCMVFRSNGDLNNNTPGHVNYDAAHPGPGFSNPDGSTEIFLYGKMSGKVQEGVEFPHNTVFTQVSNGPVGTTSSHPAVGGYWFARQCQTVAFQSDYDQLAEGHVGQHIYVYKTPLSYLEPVFAKEIPNGFPPGNYSNPSISEASPFARGPHVVFEAEPDLWNNESTGTDIFDWRDFHPRMTQYTNVGAPFSTHDPEVSDGGGVIVFSSEGELLLQERPLRTGESPPFNEDANSEIFRLKGRRRVFQITQTEGCENVHPVLKDDGKRIAFLSTCDLLSGHNSGGNRQIFLWSLERATSKLIKPGGCELADRCCYEGRDGTNVCYHHLLGRKPKIFRPNCVEKTQGCK